MRRRWAVCPSLGRSDSWRTIWRIPSAADDLYVVRGEDQRGCEDPLDPAEAYRVIDRWAADRDARAQLLKLYDVLRAPPLGPGLPDAVMERTVKPRLHEAFKRGELLLIRVPPRGIGAGAADALLAPAAAKLPPEKKKQEQVERLLLQILRVDDHFVPKTEKLDIVYELEGFSGKSVRLDIESKHLGLVFSKDLEAPERTDGSHTFYWDGKCTSPADRYAHPLFSPFRVHLYHNATWTDERNFKILYHSIVLKNGPWTPDEKEPAESDEKLWAAYKLNQLGYYGGPVGTDLDDYLKRAIIRYKANHKKLREQYYPNYDDTISPAFKAALKAKENDRKFPVPAATEDPGAKSVLNVEALTYESTGPGADEFGDKRSTHEKDRLNRPLVPVEVEIWLKKKDNSKVFQPEAVGPCRIAWRSADPDEDLSPQYAKTASEPSMTKTFIEKSLKLKSGRTGTNGDNCHKDFAGIREDPATNWRSPFQTGDSYVPYSVQEDGGNKVVYTIACEDKAQYPKRQGKAGVFFRPSYIARDDYKLSAEIDFSGQANKDELEKLHGITSPSKKIKAETGSYTVRRFNKVAMSIEWPARKNSYEWDKIATEFGKAFNDVDTKGIVTKKIGQVLTEKQVKDIVTANTAHTDPSKIGYYADYLVGVKLPKQGNLDADDYKTALKTFCHTDYNDKIQTPLGAQISENVRKEHPSGFIIVSFLLHQPVNIKNDPANGDNKVSKANAGFVTWGGSIGLADSVILADQKDPDKVYYVVSHEMGHNFYLLHWENTAENNLSDHDQDDHNCTMSYSDFDYADPGHYAFQEPGKYTPHFCGKCNLALRGWDIVAGGMAVKAIKGPKKTQVNPVIQTAKNVVVVKKKHTKAARQPVTLKTDTTFTGKGTFTRSSDAIHFFTAASKGKEITFDGKDNVFSGGKLTSGVKLYAEGASGGEVTITLALAGGDKKIGPDATAKLTSVEVTLEIGKKRTAPGVDPALLSEEEKVDPGRAIHVQDTGKKHLRALLIIKQAKPASFTGTLVLRANNGNVKVFDSETAGAEKPLPYETAANTIPPAGLKLWVEGATVSGSLKDTELKLGVKDIENDGDHVVITVLKAELNICASRKTAKSEPQPLEAAKKLDPGRAVHLQDAAKKKHRAMLVVSKVLPKDFKGTVVLTPLNAKVEAFKKEAPGEAALPNPHEVTNDKVPAKGLQLWAEGAAVSGALKDTGFKLGIKDVEDEADRVQMTVFKVDKIEARMRATPCKRDGTGADSMAAKTGTKDSKTFDATAITVVKECGILKLKAVITPAAQPVAWVVEAADKGVKAPTDAADSDDAGNVIKHQVTADAAGSFHVHCFVDANGDNKRSDDEDGLILNVNIVGIEVMAGAPNNKVYSRDTLFTAARSTAAHLVVDSGNVAAASQGINGAYADGLLALRPLAMRVVVKLTGGGADKKRGTDRVFLGYIHNFSGDSFAGTYADGRTLKEVFAVNAALADPITGGAPAMLGFPIRDTRSASNKGTAPFIINSTDAEQSDAPGGGQKRIVKFMDKPAVVVNKTHPVTGAALASIAGSNAFVAYLCAYSSDYDENYTVIAQAGWSATFGSFGGGAWTNAGAHTTAPASMTVSSPAQTGEAAGVERCTPNAVDNLKMDAR